MARTISWANVKEEEEESLSLSSTTMPMSFSSCPCSSSIELSFDMFLLLYTYNWEYEWCAWSTNGVRVCFVQKIVSLWLGLQLKGRENRKKEEERANGLGQYLDVLEIKDNQGLGLILHTVIAGATLVHHPIMDCTSKVAKKRQEGGEIFFFFSLRTATSNATTLL